MRISTCTARGTTASRCRRAKSRTTGDARSSASTIAALSGYAQLRWDTAPACVDAAHPGEIQRLYIAADWHGRGVAQDLTAACFDALPRHGSTVAWLGVWEHNPRAIAFYEKLGFVAVGAHEFLLGDDPQRDVIMVRPIDRT